MQAPQIIMLIFSLISLLYSANRHGKPKESKENFISTFISVSLQLAILYWGGFFK